MSYEIDKISKLEWQFVLSEFEDSAYYQTWEYATLSGAVPSHVVLKYNHQILAACQVNIKRLPIMPTIIYASIKMGPLFRKKGEAEKIENLIRILNVIIKEYGIKRDLLIKIEPNVTGRYKNYLDLFFNKEGFIKNRLFVPYRTLFLDLSSTLDQLRNNLSSKWRNCLRKAEKSGLEVICSKDVKYFNFVYKMAKEMVERKNINKDIHIKQINFFKNLQLYLPSELKFFLYLCFKGDMPVSYALISAIGNTGIYRLGASSKEGLTYNASYLVQWEIIRKLKEIGIKYYDLGGINPERNPGVYHFKRGIAGKTGVDETFLGEYVGAFNIRSKIALKMMECYQYLRFKLNDRGF